ncbi:hypothetical protein [Streptomyces sp. NPDC101150]|uniref:hypothetical protein n=1 Tax=Streptomyces sp. NPDC101150 TaxID=3366114 RepID=UPI0037FD9592
MTHFDFPDRLVQAQAAWYATYRELAAAGGAPGQITALRRRLHRLSGQIATDPYWASLPGRAPAARMALKELSWEGRG